MTNTKLQAPKGGCYSQDNQEWYEGGQFLPSTCLPKGLVRKVKKAMKNTSNIQTIEAKKSMTGWAVFVIYTNNLNSKKLIECFESAEEANQFVMALIEHKATEAKDNGFMPHPSNVILCE